MNCTGTNQPAAVAVLVTYRPEPETRETVEALLAQFGTVIVVDNGSGPTAEAVLHQLARLPRTELIALPENRGIATALNLGTGRARERSADWVGWFDQDSRPPARYLEALLRAHATCPWQDRVGLLAPTHLDITHIPSGEPSAGRPSSCRPVWTAMSSGCLLPAHIFDAVGYLDESLFIDYVDFEFCLRLRRAGYLVCRVNGVYLPHRLGVPRQVGYGPFRLTVRSHPPWRYYYRTRNRLLLYRRYARTAPLWCMRDLLWLVIDGLKAGLLEEKRGQCLQCSLRGLWDALRHRTGVAMLPPGSGVASRPASDSPRQPVSRVPPVR